MFCLLEHQIDTVAFCFSDTTLGKAALVTPTPSYPDCLTRIMQVYSRVATKRSFKFLEKIPDHFIPSIKHAKDVRHADYGGLGIIFSSRSSWHLVAPLLL